MKIIGGVQNQGNPVKTSFGIATTLIKSIYKSDKITVKAFVKGLKSDEITITSKLADTKLLYDDVYLSKLKKRNNFYNMKKSNSGLRIVKVLVIALLFMSNLQAQNKPNVIYILADDLGYGDLSCYGQTKFKTPNIDKLAKKGMKFTDHYSGNAVCSPSRAVLMTGKHSGHVFITGNSKDEPGMGLAMTNLPELFKKAGYKTGAYGKWGLGDTTSKDNRNPLNQGFDEFYGWKTQVTAHTYYPTKMVHNGKEVNIKKGTYVHDIIMDHAFDFIKENAKKKQPFFCYIPTAIPHAAMHAPKKIHDKWRKKLPQFENVTGTYYADPEPTPDVINPVAAFPAMVQHLDSQVGKIVKMLKKYKVDKNTLIIFTSDNGAHHEGGHDSAFWNSNGDLKGGKRDVYERVEMISHIL